MAPARKPPVSSTANSPTPTKNGKAKATASNVTVPVSTEDVTNDGSAVVQSVVDAANSSPNKSADKSKQKKGRNKKTRKARHTLLSLIRDILLATLLIYSIFVCSPDQPQSPDSPAVCRVLSLFHERVIESYVYPTYRHVLEHPTVAPYVQQAKPYVDRVTVAIAPIRARARTEWDARVVSQWEKTVIPQWNNHVVPQWNQHVVPHLSQLEGQVKPYISRAEMEYERRVGPHFRVATYNLQRWRRQAEPYVILAANKSYEGYEKVKPYAVPLWERVLAIASRFSEEVKVQRRKFVDPHVLRMWDKVTELGNGKVSKVQAGVTEQVTPPPQASQTPISEINTVAAVIAEESTTSVSANSLSTTAVVSPAPIHETVASAASVVSESLRGPEEMLESATRTASETVPDVVESMSTTVTFFSDVLSGATELVSSVASVAPASISDTVSSASSVASSVASDLGSSAEPLAEETTDSSVTSSSTSPSPSADADEIGFDLEEFIGILGDLSDDEPEQIAVEEEEIIEPVEPEQSEEERKRIALEKRRDIESRHTKWEEQLHALIGTKKKALRKALVALRKAAATDLQEKHGLRGEMDAFADEGLKLLKGAEVYLQNLMKEVKSIEEKQKLWQKVTDKVQKKFDERITKLEDAVNDWVMNIQNQEMMEVKRASDEVQALADEGQADLGMDYAWLPGVTAKDWKRYHQLAKAAKNFTELAISIQNGEHPSPPINPVQPALEEFEQEAKDVIKGFDTKLSALKREGERGFLSSDENADENTEGGPTAPRDAEPAVSILPISEDEREKIESGQGIPPVVIGRGQQEVLEAFSRVEAQSAAASESISTASHEEL